MITSNIVDSVAMYEDLLKPSSFLKFQTAWIPTEMTGFCQWKIAQQQKVSIRNSTALVNTLIIIVAI